MPRIFSEMPTVIQIDREEMARRVLTCTINVEEDDTRWLVGHIAEIPDVVRFRVVGATLDPKLGKVVTLIRDELPTP